MTNDESEEQLDSLDDLIRYLEKEKARLKKCVDHAAQEWEFSEAKAFAKAHRHVAGRLHALKNLRDPSFDERARLYRKLVFVEEQMKAHADTPQLVKHFTRELQEINHALDKLESARHSVIETQHIDDAIFQLMDGTIEKFKLHLNKGEELAFDFVCEDQLLQIGFTYKKGVLFPSMKKKLRKLGFAKVQGLRRFTRSVDSRNFKDVQHIKQLLAVAVFDVFGRSWFDKPAELEIVYKPIPKIQSG